MSKKILVIGASSSKGSINKKFATYVSRQLNNVETTVLDLNDFEMPIYCIDKETKDGIPELAREFKSHIKNTDGIIISLAEHNSSYSTAFKNIIDWTSRIKSEGRLWEGKNMMLLATSPGARGARTVLETAKTSFPRMNANLVSDFSLPSFHDNFDDNNGITNESFAADLKKRIETFQNLL